MKWKISLYLVITIIVAGLLAALQEKVNLDFEKVVLPQLAPALGFLIITSLFRDLRVPIGLDFSKGISVKSAVALTLPVLLISVAFAIGRVSGLQIKMASALSPLISTMFIGILIGSVGEEIGWRSFLQPILERSNSVLSASMIVGLFWGLFHIGHYKNGIAFMTGFLIFTISASIVLSRLLRDTGYSIVVSSLFHAAINVGSFVFLNTLTDSRLMIINGIVWMIAAAGIVIIDKQSSVKTALRG